MIYFNERLNILGLMSNVYPGLILMDDPSIYMPFTLAWTIVGMI